MDRHRSTSSNASQRVCKGSRCGGTSRIVSWLTLVAALACWTNTAAAQPVVVHLADGTVIRADRIDPASNASHIVLTSRREHVAISRKVNWENVHSAEVAGEMFSRKTLHAHFATNATPIAKPVVHVQQHVHAQGLQHGDAQPPVFGCDVLPPPGLPIPLPVESVVLGVRRDPLETYADLLAQHFPDGVPLNEVPVVLDMLREAKARQVICPPVALPEDVPPVPAGEAIGARAGIVANISVHAFPIATGGKADWNALVVELAGVDDYGRPTEVLGTLNATLWGVEQQLIGMYEEIFHSSPGRVEKVATWTRLLSDAHQPPDGAQPVRLVLPLPCPLPEHDLRLAPLADLHVELLVPGRGVLQATASEVPLRQLSLARDRQLITNGTRFFPDETTSGRIQRRLRFRDYSSIGPNRRVFTVQP